MPLETINLDVVLNQQDMNRLTREMRRAQQVLKHEWGGLKMTAWAVADALRTATVTAPKYRTLKDTGRKTRRGNKVYEVTLYERGRKKTVNVYAATKREAKKRAAAQPRNRGLAKATWAKVQGKLGRRGATGPATSDAKKLTERYGHVQMNLRGNNPFVRITNKLHYARSAFKSSGQQTLDNVLSRAAGRLMHILDAKVAKAFGAK